MNEPVVPSRRAPAEVNRWEFLVAARDLRPSDAFEKMVLYLLISRADSRGECFPSIKTICADAGIGERTAQAAIARLERRGFITTSRRRGMVTTYRIAADALITAARSVRQAKRKVLESKKTSASHDASCDASCVTPAGRAPPPARPADEDCKEDSHEDCKEDSHSASEPTQQGRGGGKGIGEGRGGGKGIGEVIRGVWANMDHLRRQCGEAAMQNVSPPPDEPQESDTEPAMKLRSPRSDALNNFGRTAP